ncbi:MAG: hypothetical protein ACREOG_07730 [Gemmatimonadaceae bacterium]
MRPILLYLGLVGLPFAALLGILRLGQELDPPRAAHGQYTVTFDSSGSGRCVFDLDSDQQLGVSQSGPRVELTWGRVVLDGSVTGDSMQAAAAFREGVKPGNGSCLTADTLAVAAAIEKTSEVTRLSGQFRLPGCATCAPVLFQALRLSDRDGMLRGGG